MKQATATAAETGTDWCLATVAACQAGLATQLRIHGDVVAVYAQASHVLSVQVDDEVVCLLTTSGPLIIAATMQPQYLQFGNDLVRIQCGKSYIQCAADGSIQLVNEAATLQLSANGDIALNGQTITQRARHNVEVNAAHHIHLNSE